MLYFSFIMEVPISNYCSGGGGGSVYCGINVSTLRKNPLTSLQGGSNFPSNRWLIALSLSLSF